MGRSATSVREEVRRICRTAGDAIGLQRSVAAVLPEAVPFDRWCGLLLDPATLLTTSGYHEEGLPHELMPRLLEIEGADEDVNGMTALVRSRAGVSTIDRATHGHPETSERWRDVLAPGGLGRELRAVLREGTVGWGGFVLLRETSAPDFTEEEVTLVAGITADLARGIRRCLLESERVHRDAVDVPGMVVVAAGGVDVELATAAGRRWLAAIERPGGADRLPVTVTAAVARARRSPDGLARARVRTVDGAWLTVYAEALSADRQARVGVILEPTRPYELAAIMADACLLTAREREVAQQVLLGRSTQEIATALFLSPWTVQDHLKKVFAKVGVRSRSELVTRLFFGHYLPRAQARTPLGGDGWFVEASAEPPGVLVKSRTTPS